MNPRELREQLRPETWAAPPSALRARILSQATIRPETVPWTDVIWFSRAWRRGALLTAIVLIGIAIWSGAVGTELSPSAGQLAATSAAEDAALQAGLEPELAAAIGRRAAARSRPLVREREPSVADRLFEGGDRE